MTPIRIDNEEWFQCPRRPLKDEPALWDEFLALYSFYKRGYLPEDGGVVDQPHKLLVMLSVFESAVTEAERSKQEMEDRPKGNPFAGQVTPSHVNPD